MRPGFVPCIFLIVILLPAGCTGTAPPAKSTFSMDQGGVLILKCAPVTISEEVILANETYTKSRIILHTESGDVVTHLAAPKSPKAAIVYAPGAGEKLSAHEERMVSYAQSGFAFLFVDTRGNGGETPGIPFSQQLVTQDYAKSGRGEMPQYYLSVCDLVSARGLLSEKFGVPVYAMGSSNGGRYAAVAAGVDPAFAGYVGISTSDWGLYNSVVGQNVPGDLVRFAASVEPGTYLARISPRPVWIFHAKKDPIIPFESGEEFFRNAQEPKTFTEFSGDHGINPDADEKIIAQWAQIYAPRG